MYLDRTNDIDSDLLKIDSILKYAKGKSLLLAMDSNARSTTWNDKLSNSRGKNLEEFIIRNQLHILNNNKDIYTFQTATGSSNVD